MSVVFFFGGLFVIFGMYFPDNIPKQFRITLGIVMALWGIYRFVVTRTKSRRYYDE